MKTMKTEIMCGLPLALPQQLGKSNSSVQVKTGMLHTRTIKCVWQCGVLTFDSIWSFVDWHWNIVVFLKNLMDHGIMGATMSDRGWQVWIRSGCYSRTWHRLWPQSWKLQLMSILVGEFPFKSHFKLVKLFWLKWTTRNRLPCSFSLKLMLRKLVEIGGSLARSLAFQKGLKSSAIKDGYEYLQNEADSNPSIIFIDLEKPYYVSYFMSSEVFWSLWSLQVLLTYIYMYIYIHISHCSYCYWRNSYSWLCQCDCSPRRQWQPHLGGCQSTGFAACKNSGSTGGIIGCDDCDEFLYKKY